MKKGLSAVGKLILVGVLLLTFLLGMGGVVFMSLYSPEVKVPDVTGKDVLVGEKELAQFDLKIRRRATRFSQEQPNTILEQSPRAGEVVKAGQTVAVILSRAQQEGDEEAATVNKETADEEAQKLKDEAQKPKIEKKKVAENKNKNAANSNSNKNQGNSNKNKNTNTKSNSNSNSETSNSNSNGDDTNKNNAGNNNGTTTTTTTTTTNKNGAGTNPTNKNSSTTGTNKNSSTPPSNKDTKPVNKTGGNTAKPNP